MALSRRTVTGSYMWISRYLRQFRRFSLVLPYKCGLDLRVLCDWLTRQSGDRRLMASSCVFAAATSTLVPWSVELPLLPLLLGNLTRLAPTDIADANSLCLQFPAGAIV